MIASPTESCVGRAGPDLGDLADGYLSDLVFLPFRLDMADRLTKVIARRASGTSSLRHWAAIVLALAIAPVAVAQGAPESYHRGMAEASAAVALDARHFVVAEDECNTLLVYRFGEEKPVGEPILLAEFLKTNDKASDIEGAARVGDLVYWISSHSLPKSGKPREWRRRFFALEIVRGGAAPPTVRPFGKPYMRLNDDMLSSSQLDLLKSSARPQEFPRRSVAD